MNCSPTLTADEFKNLHNGLWELDCMVQSLLEGNSREGQKLATIAKTLRDSLKGAYEQDRKSFEEKSTHYDDVRDQLGLTNSTWSIYEVDNLADRHPFHGAVKVMYKDHWGAKPVTRDVVGATWAALYVAANACIRDSGDSHHIYIEQFKPSKEDASVLILTTGS